MKILKFSGIVVGIHLFALILIFANPGCSSSTKPAPVPADTASSQEPASTVPGITLPASTTESSGSSSSSSSDAPIITGVNTSQRYSPTRPGSATATTLQAEPAPQFTPATTYTVVSGDNLTVIAKKNHLTIAELAAANNLKSSAKLQLGQKLIIPGKTSGTGTAAATPAAATTSSAASTAAKPADATAAKVAATESVRHTVKSGETLGGIARKYGVKQGDIAVANNISDPQKIRPGMELIIPGWQAPGGKSAAKSSGSATTKPGADPKPTFTAPPAIEPPATTPEPPPSEVPVIKVEDSPAPAK